MPEPVDPRWLAVEAGLRHSAASAIEKYPQLRLDSFHAHDVPFEMARRPKLGKDQRGTTGVVFCPNRAWNSPKIDPVALGRWRSTIQAIRVAFPRSSFIEVTTYAEFRDYLDTGVCEIVATDAYDAEHTQDMNDILCDNELVALDSVVAMPYGWPAESEVAAALSAVISQYEAYSITVDTFLQQYPARSPRRCSIGKSGLLDFVRHDEDGLAALTVSNMLVPLTVCLVSCVMCVFISVCDVRRRELAALAHVHEVKHHLSRGSKALISFAGKTSEMFSPRRSDSAESSFSKASEPADAADAAEGDDGLRRRRAARDGDEGADRDEIALLDVDAGDDAPPVQKQKEPPSLGDT